MIDCLLNKNFTLFKVLEGIPVSYHSKGIKECLAEITIKNKKYVFEI